MLMIVVGLNMTTDGLLCQHRWGTTHRERKRRIDADDKCTIGFYPKHDRPTIYSFFDSPILDDPLHPLKSTGPTVESVECRIRD